MNIQLLSDLHNEFLRNRPSVSGHQWSGDIPQTDADVIILAGDIDIGMKGAEWAVLESKRLEKPIIYILGNHEFYGHEYFELKNRIAEYCQGTNVFIWIRLKLKLMASGLSELPCGRIMRLVPDIQKEVAMLYCGNALADHRRIRVKQGSRRRKLQARACPE